MFSAWEAGADSEAIASKRRAPRRRAGVNRRAAAERVAAGGVLTAAALGGFGAVAPAAHANATERFECGNVQPGLRWGVAPTPHMDLGSVDTLSHVQVKNASNANPCNGENHHPVSGRIELCGSVGCEIIYDQRALGFTSWAGGARAYSTYISCKNGGTVTFTMWCWAEWHEL